MDQWVIRYLKEYLTPNSATFFQEHVLHADSTFGTILRAALSSLQKAFALLYPIVGPLLDRLTQALYSSPDIVVVGFIAVILLVMLQIMNWLRRAMMFWTRLVARFTFYAGIVGLGAHVYQRGLETSFNDAVSLGSTLLSWAGVLKDYWMSEYQRYESQGHGGKGHSGTQAGAGAGSWGNR